MTTISRRGLLAGAAATGIGAALTRVDAAMAAPQQAPLRTDEYLSFLHPASTDLPEGTVVGFGRDGLLAPAGQVTIDGWFFKLRGVRAPGRAIRRQGQLLLPVAVSGVVPVRVGAPGAVVPGTLLFTTQEAGVAASGGFVYHRVGTAVEALPGGTAGLVRTILSIEPI